MTGVGDITATGTLKTSRINISRDTFAGSYDEGIRIQGSESQWCGLFLGTSSDASGKIDTQWNVLKTNEDTFRISIGPSINSYLEIAKNGNVGIGTTSPSYKLHVNGTGYFVNDLSSAVNITAGGYIKGETVKVSSGCTLQYDSTQKCVKFIFS